MNQRSYFDGSLLTYIGWAILGAIVTVLTLGIAYPWALVKMYKWKIDHTVIEGRRLVFNGSAISLFAHWLKWLFLIIITFGIYSFWVHIKLEQWKVSNTTFID